MQQNDSESSAEKGSSRNLLLGVLAALMALFGYLYFFTGVIRQPGEPPQPAQAPQQQVKQPLPPRTGAPAQSKPSEAPTPSTTAAKPQPVQPAAPTAKSAAAPKPAQEPAPAPAKPAPLPAKPAVPQPAPPKTAQQTQRPASGPAKVDTAAQKPPASQPKGAVAKPEPPKVAKKPAVAYQIATTGIASRQKADRIADQLKKAGLVNVRKETGLAPRPMNRLFVTEFADRSEAAAELDKLRKLSPGAFILPSNGRYELYAGSYDKATGAESEKKRLEAKGVKLTQQKAEVKLPVYHITAEAASKELADESVKSMKKHGVDATATPAKK